MGTRVKATWSRRTIEYKDGCCWVGHFIAKTKHHLKVTSRICTVWITTSAPSGGCWSKKVLQPCSPATQWLLQLVEQLAATCPQSKCIFWDIFKKICRNFLLIFQRVLSGQKCVFISSKIAFFHNTMLFFCFFFPWKLLYEDCLWYNNPSLPSNGERLQSKTQFSKQNFSLTPSHSK